MMSRMCFRANSTSPENGMPSRIPELTEELGSHYFITDSVLDLSAASRRAQRVAQLEGAMEEENGAMLAMKFDLRKPLQRRIYTGPSTYRTQSASIIMSARS